MNFLHMIDIQIFYAFLNFRIFGVTEVYEVSKLVQTVLFLTDFVFYVLFTYFDESMGSIGGYETMVKLEYSRYNANMKLE